MRNESFNNIAKCQAEPPSLLSMEQCRREFPKRVESSSLLAYFYFILF
jgi:hypothetical protein